MKKVLAGIVAAVVVASFGWTHRDQVTARVSCAEKVAHQLTTTSVVSGAYDCLTFNVKYSLQARFNINNGKDFAAAVATPGATYTYLGETNDSGYTYRLDLEVKPHNEVSAAAKDVAGGDFAGAWSEVNGDTQLWISVVDTFYLYPSGYHEIGFDGTSRDVGGLLEAVK